VLSKEVLLKHVFRKQKVLMLVVLM